MGEDFLLSVSLVMENMVATAESTITAQLQGAKIGLAEASAQYIETCAGVLGVGLGWWEEMWVGFMSLEC